MLVLLVLRHQGCKCSILERRRVNGPRLGKVSVLSFRPGWAQAEVGRELPEEDEVCFFDDMDRLIVVEEAPEFAIVRLCPNQLQ